MRIGAKVVRHARHVTFQMAEVAIPRRLFATILRRIRRLCPIPPKRCVMRGLHVPVPRFLVSLVRGLIRGRAACVPNP